ncbi:hypothetical protein BJ138DRAFT_421468 [Hygrophoropsis aurantiaca]|uniref:Uncharacterized protein n=1 Tax=Hygrophoropsis aurantiaca TaxID=72124 RepID=A0ACB8A4H7_9AGAM|nr:hypothetical protein BJ138DRAFT_421468 [Hygrophoropsis aurantiaca]
MFRARVPEYLLCDLILSSRSRLSQKFFKRITWMLDGMLLSTVEQMYADTWTVRCSDVSAVIVLLWDYFLTLDDEVTYVWSSRRSTVKFLILFNRYGNILAQSLFLAQSIGLLDIQFSSCLIFTCVKALSHFLSFSSVHSV